MILTEAVQLLFLQKNSSQPVGIAYWQGRGASEITGRKNLECGTTLEEELNKISAKMC